MSMNMYEVALRNYTDEEVLRAVDRSNVEVAALCRIVERGESPDIERLRSEASAFEQDLDEATEKCAEAESKYEKLFDKLHEKYPAIAKELGV